MQPGLNVDQRARPKSQPARNPTADKLIVAASELMIERHSIEFSLSDLAQRSGVNSALVKYHFGNKEGLLVALAENVSAVQLENLDYLMRQPITPTAKLKLHIGGIINAYYRYPYINRLLHFLLHESSPQAASAVSKFFARPLFEFQSRLLAEGAAAGEFRKVDPVLFYTSLIGACDYLFYGRHIMSRAVGVGEVTDEVRRQYIDHMTALICDGVVTAPATTKVPKLVK
jgi:AcrR family transcriptional regulator